MFDLHYDLLTVALIAKHYKKEAYLNDQLSCFGKGKIEGVFANLYFMEESEMEKHLGTTGGEIDVVKMFQESKDLLASKVDADLLYSLEGCDYVKDEEELLKLYHLGLDSIFLVRNKPNRFGSGPDDTYGLTASGKKMIETAIELGMGLDLSHANIQTFYDILACVKEAQSHGKKVSCYASHSNSYELTPVPRNLKREQLLALNEVGGRIGVVLYPPFLGGNKKEHYLAHVSYMLALFGEDKVMISSDDMDFVSMYNSEEAIRIQGVYPLSHLASEVGKDVESVFGKRIAEKILFKNAKALYNEIKEKRTC